MHRLLKPARSIGRTEGPFELVRPPFAAGRLAGEVFPVQIAPYLPTCHCRVSSEASEEFPRDVRQNSRCVFSRHFGREMVFGDNNMIWCEKF